MKDRQYIFNEVLAERERQDIKHGDKNKTLTLQQFGNVLTEEVGEVITDINDFAKNDYNPKSLREELIQVAALAIAGIEKIDAGDVAFLYPQAHIYFQLLRANLSFKYSMGVTQIKMLGKNTLPAPKTIATLDRYADIADSIGYVVQNVQDFDCEFQVWEFWAYDRSAGECICAGFVYTDTYSGSAKWQAYGFSGIDTQRCYDLAYKMVGLIS
jgi:NTP pyrophosphatase (non-canonical NTP hydrolase)